MWRVEALRRAGARVRRQVKSQIRNRQESTSIQFDPNLQSPIPNPFPRRGVVLLVVLALLALFGLIAVAFVVLSGQAQRSAQEHRADRAGRARARRRGQETAPAGGHAGLPRAEHQRRTAFPIPAP